MASTNNSKRPFCSSSTSSSNSKWRYDVFLSFRGEDTRRNFTSHLYKALDHGNIETFMDDEELPRGEEIGPELLKAIEGSRIAIIVFSKTYAHSKWCLEELVKIMECREEKGQTVFPIFYHVEPSDVRNQTGSYGQAFNNHESNADEEKKKKIEKWRTALTKAGHLSGFPLQDRSEAKLIEEIIGKVRRLIPKFAHVGENIVGMDENLKEVKRLIAVKSNEVSMVGIYGIGGIGKTTITKVVYNDMLGQFKHHSFLENVREQSKDDRGLLQLQEKLLCDILMVKNLELSNIDEGIKMIKSKCSVEKVFIVLDDVDCLRQLDFLAPNSKCFHQGSIIIVTTRNKRCLDEHESYSQHQVEVLAHEKAKELFCWNAFRKHHPEDKYVDLSNRILDYAKGLPLALVVLGSHLYRRDVDFWNCTLEKLKTTPFWDIQKVLQISYDGLEDDEYKKLFLDIACFFKDEDEKFVTRILEGCKFHPKTGLTILDERCLISITDGTIRMHDLVQELGWAIVRQNYPERPEKWSRLWELGDIKDVLTENKGTENIEGILINWPDTPKMRMRLSTEAFRKMNRLRLLKVAAEWHPPVIELPSQDFELPCHDLVYFHWETYPLETLPSNFHAKNLVELNLRCSKIKHLWEGNMPAKKLKVIDLSFSEDLVDISSISTMPNLEILILGGCRSLQSLPSNLHELKCLRKLFCYGCSKIESFPDINEEMRSLRELNLSQTGIWELPSSSIGHLNGLEDLDLNYCKNLLDNIGSLKALKSLGLARCRSLESLPDSIESLKALEVLYLFGCTSLKSLPDGIGSRKALQKLDLLKCISLKSLQDNIGSLKALQALYLSECISLKSLPDSIGSLKALQALYLLECTSLKSLPDGIGSLKALELLYLAGCINLKSLPDSIGSLKALQKLSLADCTSLESLPDSIGSLKALQWLDLADCTSLESLSEGIYNLSSLKYLDIRSCPKFRGYLGMDLGFDEHSSTRLYLTCHISNSGVIWDNCSVSSLKALNPRNLSSLVELSVRNSHLMKRGILNGGFYLSLLRKLSLRNLKIIEGGIVSDIVRDIFHLSSLVELSLIECNLMEVGTLQSIWNLPSLRRLHLRNCNLREGEIPNHVWHLSSLEELFLDGNHFSSLPAGISQLTNLRVLNLSHCKNLQRIPELPSRLRFFDARCSGGISSSPSPLPIYSMFNCFESDNRFDSDTCFDPYYESFYYHSSFKGIGNSFVIPRSGGILDWMSYQSIPGGKVMIELPLNWYENKDLLGFALFCVYESGDESTNASDNEPDNGSACESENELADASDNEPDNGSACESENESADASDNEPDNGPACGFENESTDTSDYEETYSLSCVWKVQGNNELPPVESWELTLNCVSHRASDGVWVIFYPKVALKEAIKKLGRYNQWTCFMSSFFTHDSFVRLKEYGIRFIYTVDCEQMHPTMAQGSTSHGNFGEHGLVREDTNSKAHNKRNLIEQSLGEESHHKRFKGTQD